MSNNIQYNYKNYSICPSKEDNIIWIKINGNEGGWAICFDEWDSIDYKKVAENHINNNFISNDISMGRISG